MGFNRDPVTGHVYGTRPNGDTSFSTETPMPALLQKFSATGLHIQMPTSVYWVKYPIGAGYYYKTTGLNNEYSQTFDIGTYTPSVMPQFTIVNTRVDDASLVKLPKIEYYAINTHSNKTVQRGVFTTNIGSVVLHRTVGNGNYSYSSVKGDIVIGTGNKIQFVVKKVTSAFSWTGQLYDTEQHGNHDQVDVIVDVNGYLCSFIGDST